MATYSAILTPAQAPATVIGSLAAGASTVEQALGYNQIFGVNATQDITIRFGPPGLTDASATDFRVPAGSTMVWDVGRQYTSFKCYNLGASSCNIYIIFLSKF